MKYGLFDPITNADKVSDEMFRAHQYQNKLIEIEKWRRNEIRSLEGKAGNIPELEQAVIDTEKVYLAADSDVKNANKKARADVASKEQKETRKTAKKNLTEAKKKLQEARKLIRTDPAFKEKRETIHQQELEKQADLRKSDNAPWFGTYMLVELAHDLTRRMPYYDGILPNDPKFRRWNGNGRLGIQQFQPHEPISKVVGESVDSKYVQIVPYLNGETRKGGKKPLKLLRVRIGTDENRQPIWAEFPMVYHRPLPNNGAVAMVQVMRRRIGTHMKWEVSITVKLDVEEYKPNVMSAIAFDLGWRTFEDHIRVACYSATDSQKGEIAVPQSLINRLRKVEDLRSTIDKEFDGIRSQLIGWMKENDTILPDWLKEKTQHIDKWKSPGRLVSLIGFWNDNRFAGDEAIIGVSDKWNSETKTLTRGNGLVGWRSHQLHLYNWECHQSSKARGQLRELYRTLAAKFAGLYDVVVFEDIDLSNLARGKVGSTNRQLTAPSMFRNACKNAFRMRQKQYREVPARNTSKECNDCGMINEFGAALMYVCKGCKKEIDRDENAADNVLSRYLTDCESEVVEETAVTGPRLYQ